MEKSPLTNLFPKANPGEICPRPWLYALQILCGRRVQWGIVQPARLSGDACRYRGRKGQRRNRKGYVPVWPELSGGGAVHGNPVPGDGRPLYRHQRRRGQRQPDGRFYPVPKYHQ